MGKIFEDIFQGVYYEAYELLTAPVHVWAAAGGGTNPAASTAANEVAARIAFRIRMTYLRFVCQAAAGRGQRAFSSQTATAARLSGGHGRN